MYGSVRALFLKIFTRVQQDQTRRILISGRSSPPDTFKLNSKAIFLAGAAAIFVLSLLQNPVHAQAATSPNEVISSTSAKFIAAGVVFALAAVGAGYGVGHAGAAAMAALAERPEVRSMALIITALAEAIAIYGLARFLINMPAGQPGHGDNNSGHRLDIEIAVQLDSFFISEIC